MSITQTVPTENQSELEKIARRLSKKADTDASEALVMSGSAGSRLKLVLSYGDVYEALNKVVTLIPRTDNRVAIVTCGWAAPVGDDDDATYSEVAPSLHPRRRRIALVCVHDVGTGETVSSLKFSDSEELVVDYGNASGSLAEAISDLGREIISNRNSE